MSMCLLEDQVGWLGMKMMKMEGERGNGNERQRRMGEGGGGWKGKGRVRVGKGKISQKARDLWGVLGWVLDGGNAKGIMHRN